MRLDSLLKVAVLTPTQVGYVVARLLDADAEAADVAAEAGSQERRRVRVTAAGEVIEVDDGSPGVPVAELQESLLRSARQLPAHPRPYQRTVLQTLEHQATGTDRPAGRARLLRAALTDALGPRAESRIRGELAALVEAYGHVAVVTPPPRPDLLTAPPTMPPELRRPTGRPALRRGPRRRARIGLVLTGVVLLALAVAAGGYLVLREPEAGATGSSGAGAGRGGEDRPSSGRTSATKQTERSHRTSGSSVPVLAPRSADRIRGVALVKSAACRAGSACPVTVTVRLAPASTSQAVSWRVGVVRPCVKRVTWSPGGSVTAQPGWTTVYASSSVPVPRGRDLGLVAVTSAPARAQSPPVPVTGSLRC